MLQKIPPPCPRQRGTLRTTSLCYCGAGKHGLDIAVISRHYGSQRRLKIILTTIITLC